MSAKNTIDTSEKIFILVSKGFVCLQAISDSVAVSCPRRLSGTFQSLQRRPSLGGSRRRYSASTPSSIIVLLMIFHHGDPPRARLTVTELRHRIVLPRTIAVLGAAENDR